MLGPSVTVVFNRERTIILLRACAACVEGCGEFLRELLAEEGVGPVRVAPAPAAVAEGGEKRTGGRPVRDLLAVITHNLDAFLDIRKLLFAFAAHVVTGGILGDIHATGVAIVAPHHPARRFLSLLYILLLLDRSKLR